jgi:uncharacterized membrane protein YagU involved in acid resistance
MCRRRRLLNQPANDGLTAEMKGMSTTRRDGTNGTATIERCLLGGLSGALATWPMTAVMRALHRRLPAEEQYPLPPRQISMNVASKIGAASNMDENERFTVTMVAHYGYGLLCGVLYAACHHRGSGSLFRGAAFGLTIWAVSYLGLLPAIGLFRPATQQPLRRNALMIAAHVVWGVALEVLDGFARKKFRKRWAMETVQVSGSFAPASC